MEAFRQLVYEIQDIKSTQALLGWDLETYMPEKGAGIRANQMSTLAKLAHEKLTSPAMGQHLTELRSQLERLDKLDRALVKEVGRQYDKATQIPVELLQEFVQTTAEAHHVWSNARQEKKFSLFAPILQRIVDLNKRMADVLGYEGSPYNALLDEYEPGLTVAQLDPLFANLKAELIPLIQAIQASPSQLETDFLHQDYDTEKQLLFSRQVIEEMGFDFRVGRLDLSVHPFSSGTGSQDVRLTTRVFDNDVFSALSSSMHEAGHGMYEQGINPELDRTPLGDGTSLGIHESQSRMWENVVGRSRPFWSHYYPRLQALFPEQLQAVTLDRFYRAINQVKPSFIRVEADEVTYNVHIIVRYEIERAIIEDRLAVAEIPEVWGQKVQEYLGITPPDDALGALQDIHWSHGSFGYFPTYTLGNLYAAQFYQQAKKEITGLEEKLAQGQLLPLREWLKEKIHWVGRSESADEIVRRVTGETLNAQYFSQYLWNKYTPIYDLKAAPRTVVSHG